MTIAGCGSNTKKQIKLEQTKHQLEQAPKEYLCLEATPYRETNHTT